MDIGEIRIRILPRRGKPSRSGPIAINAYPGMNEGAHLSEDSSELSLVGIGWGPDDLFEGDRYVPEDDVELIVRCKSVKGGKNIAVLKAPKHIERLLGVWLWKCSHMNELNRRHLPDSHYNGATKFKVVRRRRHKVSGHYSKHPKYDNYLQPRQQCASQVEKHLELNIGSFIFIIIYICKFL
jgi:hypothetical protein